MSKSVQPKVAELVAKALELGVKDEETAKALIKEKAIRSYSKLEASIKEMKPAKSVKIRKAGAVREKGPRGWKYGPVWLNSIKEGKGVALKPANLPKLKETAETYGVKVPDDITQVDLAAAIAPSL